MKALRLLLARRSRLRQAVRVLRAVEPPPTPTTWEVRRGDLRIYRGGREVARITSDQHPMLLAAVAREMEIGHLALLSAERRDR